MRTAVFCCALSLLAALPAPGADEKPKGAKEAAKAFTYPDAKLIEDGKEGPGIFHAKYTT